MPPFFLTCHRRTLSGRALRPHKLRGTKVTLPGMGARYLRYDLDAPFKVIYRS